MELIERPNLDAIYYLNSFEYTTFKNDCINHAKTNGEKTPKDKDIKTWFSILNQFCKTNIKTKGITKRIYSYSQTSPAGLGGRLFSGGAMQGIWGKYRGLLMRGIATDIDMTNCHPVLLRYICTKHGIKCTELDYYINNRDKCLAEFPSREVGKNAYLVATNNDTLLRGSALPKQLKLYDKQMKEIQKQLIDLPDYKHLADTIPEYKLTKNYNGSYVNRILCYYENIVLQHAIHVINKWGIEIAVLMFDGLMVYGDYYKNTELLIAIEEYVEEMFPSLQMKWAYKEHDNTLQIPGDFNLTAAIREESGVCSDLEGAKKLYELYPHWVYCKKQLYVFDDTRGFWTECPITINRIIGRYTDSLYLMTKGADGMVKGTKSYGNTTVLQKYMVEQLKTLCIDEAWIDTTRDSSLGKLLFTNGYMDLATSIFYDVETYGYNPKIVFYGRINHAFTVLFDDDMEYVSSIKQRLFYDTLGRSVGDYFILQIARGLAGDSAKLNKRVLFSLGETDCGKGALTTAITVSCGDYIGSFNAESLAYTKSSNDEAQKLRWALLVATKRIIISNEMNSRVELNGNLLKKLSSGGDPIIGRQHSSNETTFYTHFLPIVFANDMVKILPYDRAVDNRVRFVQYTKHFVDEPSNEFELKRDDNLKTEMETVRFQRCFVALLVKEYLDFIERGRKEIEPAEVIVAKELYVGTEKSDIIEKFLNDYEITGNDADYVKSSDIEIWIQQSKLGISTTKWGLEMNKYCKIHNHTGVVNKVKKYKGKPTRCWVGVKSITEEIENFV